MRNQEVNGKQNIFKSFFHFFTLLRKFESTCSVKYDHYHLSDSEKVTTEHKSEEMLKRTSQSLFHDEFDSNNDQSSR